MATLDRLCLLAWHRMTTNNELKYHHLSLWSSKYFFTNTFWPTVNSNLPPFASCYVSILQNQVSTNFSHVSVKLLTVLSLSFTEIAISISGFFFQWFNSLWQHFCHYTLKTASKILADSNIEWPHYNYLHQVYTKEYKGQDSLKTYSIYLSFSVNVFLII